MPGPVSTCSRSDGEDLEPRDAGEAAPVPGQHRVAARESRGSDHEVVRPTDCLPAGVSLDEHLERIEAGLIAWALRATGGNKSRAAELLHIKRTTLADRISRLGGRLLETSGTSA